MLLLLSSNTHFQAGHHVHCCCYSKRRAESLGKKSIRVKCHLEVNSFGASHLSLTEGWGIMQDCQNRWYWFYFHPRFQLFNNLPLLSPDQRINRDLDLRQISKLDFQLPKCLQMLSTSPFCKEVKPPPPFLNRYSSRDKTAKDLWRPTSSKTYRNT